MPSSDTIGQHFHASELDFVKQAKDWVNQAASDYRLVQTKLLNPRQRYIVQTIVNQQSDLQMVENGIFTQAESQRVVIAPEFFEVEDSDFDLTLLSLNFPVKFVDIRHKDVLGALIHAGLDRSGIGDIVIDSNHGQAQVVVDSALVPFIESSIDKVAKAKINWQILAADQALIKEADGQEQFLLVSSLRLDVVIAAAFNVSRAKAQELIDSDQVQVNWAQESKKDRQVSLKEVISVKKFGRISLESLSGQSKKDKIKAVFNIIHRWDGFGRLERYMALTPDEILNHEFTRKGSRAYVAREVDSFLDDVNNDYRTLLADYDKLQQENRQQQKQIEELEGQREQVNESIMFAQSAASRLRSETETEVKSQLTHAQRQAQQIVDEARQKAEAESARLAQENVDLIDEQNRLRQRVDSFRQSFTALIDQQKELLAQDELSQAVELLPASDLSQQVLSESSSYSHVSAEPVGPAGEQASLPTDLKEVPGFAKGPIEAEVESEVVEEKAKQEAEDKEEAADPTVVVFPDNNQENN